MSVRAGGKTEDKKSICCSTRNDAQHFSFSYHKAKFTPKSEVDTGDGQMSLDDIKCLETKLLEQKVLKYLGRYIQYMGTVMLVKNIRGLKWGILSV